MEEDLKQEYDKMIADIESARMFDGRGRGVDVYTCEECGEHFYTQYKDKGVTPFSLRSRNKAVIALHGFPAGNFRQLMHHRSPPFQAAAQAP